MKKFTLSIVLIMAILLIPGVIFATDKAEQGNMAKIGDVEYKTLVEAVEAVATNNKEVTIELLRDVKEAAGGIKTVKGQNIVIDFNGYTYNPAKPLVGSTGTETNGCQLLKGSKVTFKNGTLASSTAKILIQNYSNLTLEDMLIDSTNSSQSKYTLSNNCGKVLIKGNTSIKSNNIAFDMYWWPSNTYVDGVQITVDTTGTIKGDIEIDGDGTQLDKLANELTILNIKHDGKIVIKDEAYKDTVVIKGGIFSSDVKDYLAEDYVCVKQNELYAVKLDFSKVVITGISNKTYTGKEIVQNIVVKFGDKTLVEGTDYTVKYSDDITNVGIKKVTIIGKGIYIGSIVKEFEINPYKITKHTISEIKDVTYTGKEFKPSFTVKNGNITLKKGTDYTVQYLDNKNPGKATIKIIFKGNYEGEVTKTFLIIPKKITGFKVEGQTTSTVKLAWDAHEGVTGYKVYSYNSSKKKWEYIGKTDKTSYTIEKLKEATIYEYRVRAYKNIDGTQYFGSYTTSIETATKPKATTIKATAGDRKITLTWNKVSGATGYRIYMATSKNGEYKSIKTISNNKTFEYTKTGLSTNKTYYFKIRAYKQVEDKKIFSDYTKTISVKTKKVHVVKKGNTLYSISKKYKISIAKLTKLNKLKKASVIRVGLRLLLN